MKKTTITFAALTVVFAVLTFVGVCTMTNTLNEQRNIIKAQTELLQLIHDDDPDTWCDVISETDEYLNCVELDCIDF